MNTSGNLGGALAPTVIGYVVEIRHSGFRTLRSAEASLVGASADDIYQAAFSLLPGNVDDIETVELQLEAVSDPAARGEPGVREGLPKSDRLFGLRGDIVVVHEPAIGGHPQLS